MEESTQSTLPTKRDEVRGVLTSGNKVPTQTEKKEVYTITSKHNITD
jgi:hypothetical protein